MESNGTRPCRNYVNNAFFNQETKKNDHIDYLHGNIPIHARIVLNLKLGISRKHFPRLARKWPTLNSSYPFWPLNQF